MIARDFPLNMEASLMYVMYPHQLMQTMITRDLSLNVEANLVCVMYPHQLT